MTQTLDAAIANVADTINGTGDPLERLQVLRDAETKIGEVFKAARQRIANDLYAQGKPWREVGELMGGLSAQRAWQISRGE
ncbi:hypothetical protein [Streptomyces sp. NPDC059165]|uniref:hypothetical protein n=1 Tax=Streptomyces sp. NPDC059165 TaxID=3346751 RepID=UPI003693FF6D